MENIRHKKSRILCMAKKINKISEFFFNLNLQKTKSI